MSNKILDFIARIITGIIMGCLAVAAFGIIVNGWRTTMELLSGPHMQQNEVAALIIGAGAICGLAFGGAKK